MQKSKSDSVSFLEKRFMKAAVMNDIRKKSDGKRKYGIKKGREIRERRKEGEVRIKKGRDVRK
jgi:hypothetical protein